MKKYLSKMDKDYGKLTRRASISEKIKYCATLIQRTERFITTNSETLADRVKKDRSKLLLQPKQK